MDQCGFSNQSSNAAEGGSNTGTALGVNTGTALGANTVTPSPVDANKIFSRNVNGTLAVTSLPSNESELQLYRVLQRANLLSYYDTLIEQGGDDVQQLCEAGEEEFLEIMALVGMASKPLHVRRLQKALQEWLSNPAMFQTPLVPFPPVSARSHPQTVLQTTVPARPSPPGPPSANSQGPAGPGPGFQQQASPQPNHSPCHSQTESDCSPGSPGVQLTPILTDVQIQRLKEAADSLLARLPPFQPRAHNAKRKMCKELEHVMRMSEGDGGRMDSIRKFSAIYGRFDCKRKPEKPLTLHEVSVNEAAAQICSRVPALLTRRDELFPLARQVVRDSGYQYSKGHSSASAFCRSVSGIPGEETDEGEEQVKRPRLSDTAIRQLDQGKPDDGRSWQRGSCSEQDPDETDSQFSFSSASPSQRWTDGTRESESGNLTPNPTQEESERVLDFSDGRLQVLSASGSNIIAVANPVLALSSHVIPSPTIVKQEALSPPHDSSQ